MIKSNKNQSFWGCWQEMQLLICVCIAWITIILFALIPKRLTLFDFVFLYCVLLSLTLTMYTAFQLNFHIIKKPVSGIDLWATTVFRVITVPLLIMIVMDALQKRRRWVLSFAIWVALTAHDWALYRFNVIQYELSYTLPLIGIAYMGLILIILGLTWWFKRFDRGK